jgi:hypothetical protein
MVALREAYLGLSRSWRGFLGASGDAFAIEVEFAQRLMARASEWER